VVVVRYALNHHTRRGYGRLVSMPKVGKRRGKDKCSKIFENEW